MLVLSRGWSWGLRLSTAAGVRNDNNKTMWQMCNVRHVAVSNGDGDLDRIVPAGLGQQREQDGHCSYVTWLT